MRVTAAAAGATKAQELDGELLALCATFDREHADQGRLEALDEDTPDADAAGNANYQRRCDAVESITALPARTPEGIQAKALVARAVMENDALGWLGQTMREARRHERLAWSLMNHILGAREGAGPHNLVWDCTRTMEMNSHRVGGELSRGGPAGFSSTEALLV